MDFLNGISTYGLGDGSSYERNYVDASSKDLTMSDFYRLLAAQLQYQDADNPMDTSQMMVQMVQQQMVTALTNMSYAVNEMTNVNVISYASSMVGKEVTVAEVDENGKYTGKDITGIVTGAKLGSNPTIFIDGKEYSLSQIMNVGEVPKEDDKQDGDKQDGGKQEG